MIKNFIKGNFLLIFAIFFALPVVFLFVIAISDNRDFDHILNNGIETTAYIVEGTAYSTTSVNDVSYYSIEYYFYDENLNEHFGETSESFTYSQILQIEKRGTILIKYDPDTFDSIEASYSESNDKGRQTTWILLALFGVADLVIWCVVITIGRRNIILAKVEKVGKEYTANVTGISTNLQVNGVHKYKVHYTWLGENGTTMRGSSTSKYYFEEASALEMARTITIKVVGKYSVIVTNPDMCLHKHYENLQNIGDKILNSSNQTIPEKPLTCDYCGHNIAKDDEYCGNCGARVNIYK